MDEKWDEILGGGPVAVDRIWSGADDLRNGLLDSAMHHAGIALRDFTRDGNDVAIAGLHAGIAVEHLAKCYLASIHPVLLAEKGCDLDTLLRLVGKGELARTSAYGIKTVGGVEAFRRVRYLLPEFRFNDQADGFLFSVRNSVGHLGLASDVRKAMRIMVSLIDPLLTAAGYDRTMFWSNRILTVDTLRDETMDEMQATLRMKYEAARQHLESLLAGLDSAARETLKAIIAKGSHPSSDHEEPYSCPVCGSQGWLICSREHDLVEDESDPDYAAIIFNEPVAYPVSFRCNVCELDLEDAELEAAGMPSQIDLPDSEVGKKL